MSLIFGALEADIFDTSLGKKLVALGLTSLLSLPSSTLPAPVTQVLPHAFSAVVKVTCRPITSLESRHLMSLPEHQSSLV